MTPPGHNTENDLKPVMAADLARLVWGKTRRRTLYRQAREAVNDIHFVLSMLLDDQLSAKIPVEFFAGTTAARFRRWVFDCPGGIIVLTERARLKGVANPAWRTKLCLGLARLGEDPGLVQYLLRYEAELAEWRGAEGGREESCPFSRTINRKARVIIKRVADEIYVAARPLQAEIEAMFADLLAKSPFKEPRAAVRLRKLIPIERLVNRATLERLKREFARAEVDWESGDEISIDAKLSALAERVLAGHKKAIVREGYDWDDVVTVAMELGMG